MLSELTNKLVIGHLFNIPDEFMEHFSSYGEVVDHQIMVDHSTGRSRGFGFITFESAESVENIISEGRMHNLAGKQVILSFAKTSIAIISMHHI